MDTKGAAAGLKDSLQPESDFARLIVALYPRFLNSLRQGNRDRFDISNAYTKHFGTFRALACRSYRRTINED
jgi:hypothetical protein